MWEVIKIKVTLREVWRLVKIGEIWDIIVHLGRDWERMEVRVVVYWRWRED